MNRTAFGFVPVRKESGVTIADEKLEQIEDTDLAGLGRADIDDVLEYVHVPSARLPQYRALYDRYLRQRWNVNELDFSADVPDWTDRMTDDSRNSFSRPAICVSSAATCAASPSTAEAALSAAMIWPPSDGL